MTLRVEGEVKYVIGFVVGAMDFEQLQFVVDVFVQTDAFERVWSRFGGIFCVVTLLVNLWLLRRLVYLQRATV